jgi:isopentenyl-diphosphate delta-isomerase
MRTEERKDLHIKNAIQKKMQFKKSNLFEEVELIHNPLVDFELNEIQTKTKFMGKTFSFPLSIRPMTGGTKKSLELNKNIAVACERKGIGFSLGSIKAGLEKKRNKKYFKLRKFCPTVFLEANIGALELDKYSAKEIDSFLSEIQADAISVHLNAMQELIQNAKTTGFSRQFSNIKKFAETSSFPVIVKEVGNGISFEAARKLNETKIKAIDVAGKGGTSFTKIDSAIYNRKKIGETFAEFGIPTAASILLTKKACNKKIIASGGIRNGLEIAKSIILGSDLAGISMPALKEATKGTKAVENMLEVLEQELKISMFLVGAKKIEELKRKKFVLQNNLLEWTKSIS